MKGCESKTLQIFFRTRLDHLGRVSSESSAVRPLTGECGSLSSRTKTDSPMTRLTRLSSTSITSWTALCNIMCILMLAVSVDVCEGVSKSDFEVKRISSKAMGDGNDFETVAGYGPPHVSGDGTKVVFAHEGDFTAPNNLPGDRAGFGNNKVHVWMAPTDGGGSTFAGGGSLGSCYSMTTHQVTCNIAASACTSPNVHYAPGFVSSRNGCCHCVAGCDHTKETGANCAASYGQTNVPNIVWKKTVEKYGQANLSAGCHSNFY